MKEPLVHPIVAHPERGPALGYPIRMLIYAAIAALTMHLTLQVVEKDSLEHLASENGPIEIAQFAILILAASIAAYASKISPHLSTAIFSLSAGLFCAASREADDWFASMVFDDAYKWLVCLPLIAVVSLKFWKSRETIYHQCNEILSKPYGTTLAFTILMIGTLCQTLDRSSFWPTISVDPIVGDQKSVIEETVELFGYLLILFSTMELTIDAWQARISTSEKPIRCGSMIEAPQSMNNKPTEVSVHAGDLLECETKSEKPPARENVA